MSGEPNKKVSLEDLLRLKREERPAPEFWAQFDRELRAKQLAALVEKRPWWHGLPAWAFNWRRYHLPIGATAVLALTLVSLRDGGHRATSDLPVASRTVTAPVVASARTVDHASSVGASVPMAMHPVSDSGVSGSIPSVVAVNPAPVEEPAVVEGALDAVESVSPASVGLAEAMPSRFASSKVIASLEAESTLGRGMGAAREIKVPAVRGATFEPLAQMSSPTEVRRARYRTALASPVARETVAQANDRLARSLSDDRMNDTIRRFDAKADRLSLKF